MRHGILAHLRPRRVPAPRLWRWSAVLAVLLTAPVPGAGPHAWSTWTTPVELMSEERAALYAPHRPAAGGAGGSGDTTGVGGFEALLDLVDRAVRDDPTPRLVWSVPQQPPTTFVAPATSTAAGVVPGGGDPFVLPSPVLRPEDSLATTTWSGAPGGSDRDTAGARAARDGGSFNPPTVVGLPPTPNTGSIAVPEPSTSAVVFALLALSFVRRRPRRV